MKSRIAAGDRCFYSPGQIFGTRAKSKAVKIKICKTKVEPAVVFGSETLAMTEMDVTRLDMWERKILRRIQGPVVVQGMWRIRTNQELRELYKDLVIEADIKNKRLERFGHVVRMDQGRTVKKIFENKPEGSRRRGRRRMRWLEDVEKDIREMKVKR